MPTTATPVAACNRSAASRPTRVISIGPVTINGRFAARSRASMASAVASSSAIAAAAKAAAAGTCARSASPSRQSLGRLRCTGPRRPERAARMAAAKSRAMSSVRVLVVARLVSGAAMSACRISWNAPVPSWPAGAWPDSSTSGDSPIAAV